MGTACPPWFYYPATKEVNHLALHTLKERMKERKEKKKAKKDNDLLGV